LESRTPLRWVSALLKLLRRELSYLPNDARTLLRTPRTIKRRRVSPGRLLFAIHMQCCMFIAVTRTLVCNRA
jgi:hypothetical protein